MLPNRVQQLLEPRSDAMQLASLFHEAGHELYLVGGSLRDFILGRDHQDLDFATGARPEEIKNAVGDWASDFFTAGEEFGTIGIIRSGIVFEVTTFRSEAYREDTRKPAVEYSDDIDEDLSRRDFTINAMALPLVPGEEEPTLVDPWGGLNDLGAKVLRTPQSPEASFGDDPLRMLRLYRFVAILGFEIADGVETAVREMADRLSIVSAERIRDEFSRLIVADKPSIALAGLVKSGLADQFLPELPGLALDQDPIHRHKDVLAHTLAVVDKVDPDLVKRLAALFHDVGKPDTREFGAGKTVSFHHHEVVGTRLTRKRLRALKFPKQVVADVSELVYLHMRPHTFKMGWTDRAVRRYVRDAGPLLDSLNQLVRADVTTRNEKLERQIHKRIDELEERIADLREREELDALRPPIDGNAVMKHLGIEPSRRVGVAMDLLLKYRIDEGPYSAEKAYELLEIWVKEGKV